MARRVISSGKDVQETDQSGGRRSGRSISSEHAEGRSIEGYADRSKAEGFVDARRLQSEDLVSKTLQETTGTIGIMTRPKVVEFRLEPGNISVVGANEWVSESQVLDIARQQSGKSLFLVSDGAVEKQIKAIPGVTSAKSKKQLPNSLEVTIKAQKPAAMLKTSEDHMTAVDSKGRVLNSVSGVSVEGIPVIEVQNVDASLSRRPIKEALKILSSLPESMRNSITKVTAATQDSITTELNGGDRVIVWGDSSDLKLKKAVVDKIVNDPNVIGDKHNVDVSAPLRPIIK